MNKIDTPANGDQSVIHCALKSHSYLQWSTPQAWDTSTLTRGIVLNGRFALERLLGSGGMGEVWLGRDRVLGRQIAAKLIRPLDPTLRERTRMEGSLREAFIDEARIGASLAHPAIATVLDFGFFEGEPFIIFEYMDGETLRDYIARRGAIPLADARLIIGPLGRRWTSPMRITSCIAISSPRTSARHAKDISRSWTWDLRRNFAHTSTGSVSLVHLRIPHQSKPAGIRAMAVPTSIASA